MNVKDAILNRKSVRDFINKPVDIEIINQALNTAKYAPSSTNMQPWEVCIVSNASKTLLTENILLAIDNNTPKTNDYSSYPDEWFEPFKSRRRKLGLAMYQKLGIEREDKAAQIAHWKRNYESFGADKVAFIFMSKKLGEGSYIDCGMFMQNFMLALLELGVSSCPQASYIDYSDVVKKTLFQKTNVDYNEKILLAGIAIGYEKTDSEVNDFRSEREELSSFVNYAD